MTGPNRGGPGGISRRRLLQSSAATAGAALVAGAWPARPGAQAGCPPLPKLPSGVDAYRQRFVNWSKETDVGDLWTCAPRDADDVVRLANWARREGYRLRPRGAMHGWSPLAITSTTTCGDRVLIVDTTKHLTRMRITSTSPGAVRVQAGATLDSLLAFLESNGFSVVPIPTTGEPTVGGALAIGAHGASLLARDEHRRFGQTYGSLSNLVLKLTAVVWDRKRNRYVLRTFDRSDRECGALMVHLGRAFITSVTLRVSRDRNLRCQSFTDIPATELFAAPASGAERTFAGFVEESGSAEAIWFPFTERPWLKVWSVSPSKPPASREVTAPYNYPFISNLPEAVTDVLNEVISGNGAATPLFGQASFAAVDGGLTALGARDLWGKSKNVCLYVRPDTLRTGDFGYAVVTRRRDLQRAISEFAAFYQDLVARYRVRGLYPANAPVNLRVTGLDRRRHAGVQGARAPVLSPTATRPGRPNWDVALWINVTFLPGAAGQNEFFTELQRFVLGNYRGRYATVRPEWSKHWAFSERGSWTNRRLMRRRFPNSISRGRPDRGWQWAERTFDRLDPHRIFSNEFIDRLL